MSDHPFDLQLDWDADTLATQWPDRPDHRFVLQRLHAVTVEIVAQTGARRLLDVASGEASYTATMATGGVRAVAIDPSPQMLARARTLIDGTSAAVTLVRGVAETLPFRDGSFDCVLCHSAIDHIADPDLAIREMTRVLTPDGRLVIGAVNFTSAGGRLSRGLYGLGRALRIIIGEQRQFWDSPVGIEHTFECTAARLARLCAPYVDIERRVGVSIGWGVPGWGALLQRLPQRGAEALLARLDRVAARQPALADFVYVTGRPRPRSTWPVRRSPELGGLAVQPDDVVYAHKAARERRFWSMAGFGGTIVGRDPVFAALANAAYTGDPAQTWLDDLIARGPFRTAAVLGCDEDRYDARWLERGVTERLDIYEFSPAVIRRVGRQLGPLRRRVQFIAADLNFAVLPKERYDVIWSSGCLHHIVNLEHLFVQVERALRPGGLFAMHEYVGERRMQHAAVRLERLNAMLREVPARFRYGGITRVGSRDEAGMSALCSVRSDDLLRTAGARLTPIHSQQFHALFPLLFHLNLSALSREDPLLFARIMQEEAAARRSAEPPSGSAYAIFRKGEPPPDSPPSAPRP